MSHLPRSVTVSTPGKVLASGGYMVLQDGHAVVLSTTSRFYSKVVATHTNSGNSMCNFNVKVVSPQFQKSWTYSSSWYLAEHKASDFKFALVPEKSDGSNVFVQFSVFYALAAAACLPQCSKISAGNYNLVVTIQADNDFYSHSKAVRTCKPHLIESYFHLRVKIANTLFLLNFFSKLKDQGIAPTQENLRKLPNFAVLGSSIAKTGLGSSAALVSSLSTALLTWACGWNSQAELTSEANIHLAHNVAQVAHCQAQGKIGSGFDVSSGLFGSQHFVRFRSDDLNKIMEAYVAYSEKKTGVEPVLTAMEANLTSNWTVSTAHIELPPGFSMILGECGKDFNTPTSVRKVLDWAKRESEQWKNVFDSLNDNNLTLLNHFSRLIEISKADSTTYWSVIKACSALPASEWRSKVGTSETLDSLLGVRECFTKQRKLMKGLGNSAETPVEPDEISTVLDDTEQLSGVVATGAPGAGGYDAVFAMVLGDMVVDNVEKMWNAREDLPLSCLLSRECSDGVLLVEVSGSPSRMSLCPMGLVKNGPAAIASSPLLLTAVGAAALTYAVFAFLRHYRSQKS